jgi:hypothetical protein
MFPKGLIPRFWAVAHELTFILGDDRREPSSADERPDVALTESSEASSISRRMLRTDLNTPGSICGGVGLFALARDGGGRRSGVWVLI